MKPTRKLSRRSFLGRVAGGAIAGGAALTILGETAHALQVSDSDSGANSDPPGRGYTGVTDADSGPNSDRAGHGRGGRRGGTSDSDSGRCADTSGRGRGPRRRGVSDSDSGACGDPANNGRGRRRSTTDNDSGGWADPAGNGRGPRRTRRTNVTDGDSGGTADAAGFGRGRDHEATTAARLREGRTGATALPSLAFVIERGLLHFVAGYTKWKAATLPALPMRTDGPPTFLSR